MPAKKSFLLRLSQEMWEELERWAADDFRSVNGQIESILHEAIGRRRKKAPPADSQAGQTPAKEEQ
ncbi:MAG: Arc family DNA-binding protein [Chrysiogenia bacterium]